MTGALFDRSVTMKSVIRNSSLPGILEKISSGFKTREVFVEEPEDGSLPLKAYLSAVRKARRGDCIMLPPGEYPTPQTTGNLTLRAMRPGTVTLKGTPNRPTMILDQGICLWLSGISISGNTPGDLAIQQNRGCVILSSCHVSGGIEISGPEASLYCESCRLDRAEVGLSLSGGATAELWGSAVSGCPGGISAGEDCVLALMHARVEGACSNDPESPSAGLHAKGASVYCAGTLFIGNQVGAHLKDCKEVEFLFCLFEQQLQGGFMMSGGGPLHMHGCVFREQKTTDYAHVTLGNVTGALDFCEMDPSAGLDVDSAGSGITQRKKRVPIPPAKDDVFASVLFDLRQEIGMSEFKSAIENILHQAHAALQRRKRGLTVPPLKFHCIFEGPDGSGRRQAAVLFSRALNALGLLSGNGNLVETRIEDLLHGRSSIAQAVESARGGLLMLHAPEESNRRDARLAFSGTREILRQALATCGTDTILIFTGPRDAVRPVLCNSQETEERFRATIHFSLPSPAEVAEMFAVMAAEQNIRITTQTRLKILLALHMMHDRRDHRFLNAGGIAKLMDAAHNRYYERCSREQNFDLLMDAEDLDVPLEKMAEPLLQAQPAFVSICPKCESENPWVPGMEKSVRCANCEHEWDAGWGIWVGSAYYRVKTSGEKAQLPRGLPPHRTRAALPA